MPIRTETFDLAAEYDDLCEQIDDLESQREEYAENTPHFEQATAMRDELVRRRQGLERFAELYPECGEIVLGELSPGEYATLDSHLSGEYSQQEYRNVMTGVASVEAPYVVEGDGEATLQAVWEDVPPYFTRWATDAADDLLRPDGVEDNPFSQPSPTQTTADQEE